MRKRIVDYLTASDPPYGLFLEMNSPQFCLSKIWPLIGKTNLTLGSHPNSQESGPFAHFQNCPNTSIWQMHSRPSVKHVLGGLKWFYMLSKKNKMRAGWGGKVQLGLFTENHLFCWRQASLKRLYLLLNMTVHGLSWDRIVIYLSERNPLTFLSGHLQVSNTLNWDQDLDLCRFNSSTKCTFCADPFLHKTFLCIKFSQGSQLKSLKHQSAVFNFVEIQFNALWVKQCNYKE